MQNWEGLGILSIDANCCLGIHKKDFDHFDEAHLDFYGFHYLKEKWEVDHIIGLFEVKLQ